MQPDRDTTPRISITVNAPQHLRSNLTPSTPVDLSFTVVNVDDATAQTQVKSAFSLATAVGKTAVSGTWTFDMQSAIREARFTASAPLPVNADYLARVQKLGLVVPQREYTMFRVGSLPRIMGIRFSSSKGKPASDVDQVGLEFSEPVSTAKVAAGTVVKSAGSPTVLSVSPLTTETQTWSIGLQLGAALPLTTKLSITIPIDVGAPTGVKLDGKYTGVAGSGPFAAEILVKDFTDTGVAWQPALTF